MDSIHWIGRTVGCFRPTMPQPERSRVGVVSGEGGGLPVSAHSPLPREAVQAVGPRRSLLTLLAATVALVTSPLSWAAGAVAENTAVIPEPTPRTGPFWDADLEQLNEGLVEYWPLQDGPASTKGKGIVSGQVDVDQSGPLGGSTIFDGATYIYGPASGFPTASRTVVLNFYPTKMDSSWYFFSYGGGSVCGSSFIPAYYANTKSLGVHRHCSIDDIAYSDNYVDPASMLDRWNQLAVTMGRSGTKIFLNGRKLFDSPIFYANTDVKDRIFCIGTSVKSDGATCYTESYFPGKLSDIRLWNRELSESEVKAVGCFDSNHSGGKLVMEGGCDPFPEEFITEPLYPAGHSGTATLPNLVRYHPFQGDLLDYGPFQHPFMALGSGLRHTAEGVQVTASTLLRASASDLGAFERTVSMTFKNLDLAVGKSTWLFAINGFEYPKTCGEGYSVLYSYSSGDSLSFARACDPTNMKTASYPLSHFAGVTHLVSTTSKLGRTSLYLNGQKVASRVQFPVSMATRSDEYVTLFWAAKRDGYLYTGESDRVASGGTVREFSILNGAVSDSQVREMWRQLMSPSPSATPPAASASASACPPAPSQSECPVPPTCAPLPSHSMTPSPVIWPTCPPQETEFVVVERFVNRTVEVCTTPPPMPVDEGTCETSVPVWGVAIVGMAPAALLGCCVYMVMQRRLQDVSAQNVMQRSGSSAGGPGLKFVAGFPQENDRGYRSSGSEPVQNNEGVFSL